MFRKLAIAVALVIPVATVNAGQCTAYANLIEDVAEFRLEGVSRSALYDGAAQSDHPNEIRAVIDHVYDWPEDALVPSYMRKQFYDDCVKSLK